MDVYDIFLSFRGVDTRNNFTGHLCKALVDAGFRTFQDDTDLDRGENIKEGLDKAIQQSRCSVIVFSKDYTSSKWCLDELVMILERRRNSDHVVFPIFYDPCHSPSHLKRKAECLAEVPGYQNQSLEKFTSWREALKEVTTIAGNELQNEANRHEPTFIKNIVGIIQKKLPSRRPLSHVQKQLEDKLVEVNPILDVAEGRQLKFQTSVKPWLHKLRESVYEAEDLLQEIKTEALRQEMEPESESSTRKVQALISSPPYNAFNSALVYPKVKKVLETLDYFIKNRRDVLGMKDSTGYNLHQTIPSTSLVEDSGVCGRDDEKEKLIQLLLSDDESGNKISVIPILGMGGIGKTTLAQLLYNDVTVKEHFDIRGWACVSEKFDVVRISQQVYESLTSDACNILNLTVLQDKLRDALLGKKFLLVLDDVWNKNYRHWEVLRRPFQYGAHGSKIIVTTRNQDVASMVRTLEAHHLMPMSEEDGWSLFEKHAFKNIGAGGQSHLEKIGRQIVRKCKGLPLAIKSLGGLLCSKSNADEWESILNSEMWELPQEESDILPSLWLSYKYLTLELKRCFAYCSIFPKNYQFDGSDLILLWKAVGLLQPGNKKSAEEIGRDYFNDLISRSFFQHSPTNSRDVEPYSMHDLINDLASFVSGEFCARWEGSNSRKISSKTRHVNVDFDTFEASHPEYFFWFHHPESLRTLLLTEYWDRVDLADSINSLLSLKKGHLTKGHLTNLLSKLQCLRVLNLSGYGDEELPDSINSLKHLSHLDLSSTGIKMLPDTICTLYNLQHLLLRYCEDLTELPANLGRLINLSHLDIEGTRLIRMPRYMGNLKNLQILPRFVLDRDTAEDNLAELGKLQSLRGRLYITGLEHRSGLEADILREKKFLNELVLEWRPRLRSRYEVPNEESEDEDEVPKEEYSEADKNVLYKLQPHLNLERLTIEGYGGKMFPGWPGFYSSSALVHLTLVNCNCVSLPPLGQLPLLTELEISWLCGVMSIGSEFYYGEGRSATTCVNKPFRSLKSLKFEAMKGWKEWCTFVGGEDIVTFPKLTTLTISRCYELSSLPEKMDSHFPSLLSLSIIDCRALECIRDGGFPSKLKSLEIEWCRKLKMNNDCLRRLSSLKELKLHCISDEKREDWIASEDEGLLPSSLTHLQISNLNCETIDKWFGHLNSLQSLVIEGFPLLRCLPDSGLPSSLSRLKIDWCPLLEKRCERETGEDWPKIAHIPYKWIG